ncbi:MAG: sialidase family protein [Actinomycetota bacterium]
MRKGLLGAHLAGLVLVSALALPFSPTAEAAVFPKVRLDAPASATDRPGPRAHNSPAIAADPTNPKFMVLANRIDAQDYSCALQVSGDGGGGWVGANPVPRLPKGAEKCYAPEVAFDREGTLYYLFLGLAGPGNVPMGAFITTSRDRGRTFSTPRKVLGPRSFQVRMAIDTSSRVNRLHLVWVAASDGLGVGSMPTPPNPILAKYSDDGGKTFSRPVQVNEAKRKRVIAPVLALGRDGGVHVMYYDLVDDAVDYHGLEGPAWEGTWTLVASSSNDRGKSFGRHAKVTDEIVPPGRVMLIFTMPAAAVSVARSGRLVAAWPDGRGGDPDIMFSRSRPDGKAWSAPRRLNDDKRGSGKVQDLPRLSVAPNGRIDAIFYDRRNSADNKMNEVFYAYSNNEGKSFATNVRLTAKPSNSSIGKKYGNKASAGLTEFGARLGLASGNSRVVAAWTDTRSSYHPLQQDIFSTVVTFSK